MAFTELFGSGEPKGADELENLLQRVRASKMFFDPDSGTRRLLPKGLIVMREEALLIQEVLERWCAGERDEAFALTAERSARFDAAFAEIMGMPTSEDREPEGVYLARAAMDAHAKVCEEEGRWKFVVGLAVALAASTWDYGPLPEWLVASAFGDAADVIDREDAFKALEKGLPSPSDLP